jgi:ABC-2 type transport system permease protein
MNMKTQNEITAAAQLQACVHLAGVSLRRLLRSRQTMISVVMFFFAVLVVIAWSIRRERTPQEFVEQIAIPIYVSFLLPLFCLCYASASISGEREEGALVYVLMTPLPRPLIHMAKYAAALVLSLSWTMGGFAILCGVAGGPGSRVFQALWPSVFFASMAYVSLFHLFSVVFRRATIIALAYALFFEVFLGKMPGTVKRLAVNFYTQCLMFDASAEFGVSASGPYKPMLFLPVSAPIAFSVLGGIAIGLFLLGTWLFARIEYD